MCNLGSPLLLPLLAYSRGTEALGCARVCMCVSLLPLQCIRGTIKTMIVLIGY